MYTVLVIRGHPDLHMVMLVYRRADQDRGAEGSPNSMLRRWLGVCACFFVSGVMHEVIYRFERL